MDAHISMVEFLTAVSSKKIVAKPIIHEVQDLNIQDAVIIDSVQSALQVLKGQPNHGTVVNVLAFLSNPETSIVIPQPIYASIAHELVNNIVPNFWRVLRQHSNDYRKLATILRNPTGIGHLITRLRSLIVRSRQRKAPETTQGITELIEDSLDVLTRVLSGDEVSQSIWEEIQTFGKNDIQRRLMWKEFLAQVASGRVLSIRAEAEDVLTEQGVDVSRFGGKEFADWLGRNIFHMLVAGAKSEACIAALVELSSKALTLGYTGESTRQTLVRFG